MLDFVNIKVRTKKGEHTVYPEFLVGETSEDLMIRGKAFYAIWNEKKGLWDTKESTVQRLVDSEIRAKLKDFREEESVEALYLKNFSSKKWTEWLQYVKSSPDSFHELDSKITFSNDEVTKTDYRSKRLNYPLEDGDYSAWDTIVSTLYSPEEREKIEWSIGAIISGDASTKLQKFMVLYGEAGTGKSTILNIIQGMFPGYWIPFNAKELGQANNSFALEQFKKNPLIAIQHDGDLSRIEDNTLLNSIVAHEPLTVNEKFKNKYEAKVRSFLYLGTNRPVKITEAKSGIIRRLIDVKPTGNHIPPKKYEKLMEEVQFQYGAIAYHCLQVYKNLGRHYYDSYRAVGMIGETNDFYNFIEDEFAFFSKEVDYISLTEAWTRYRKYVDDSNVPYPLSKMKFKSELKNYFQEFYERYRGEDGSRPRNVYVGFLKDKFFGQNEETLKEDEDQNWLCFKEQESIFDETYNEMPAQLTTDKGTPKTKWSNVTTKLKDISTKDLHYVKVPENHIVIDFDIKGDDGNKSLEKNIEAVKKWPGPKTYAELSKSEAGIHLHYIYDGDPTKLSNLYSENVEVKVYTGNSSLRRKLTKCNDLPIAHISSGLPLKGEKTVVNWDGIQNEKTLRAFIKNCLQKKHHGATKPEVDYIYTELEKYYESGKYYDVTDMRPSILSFATQSSHQANECIKLVNKMKFRSEEPSINRDCYDDDTKIFYDVEVFPNLLLVCWKAAGQPKEKAVRWYNPTPDQISELVKLKLVGFNNRRYDNHILYARMMGYDNEHIFKLSQRIINKSTNAMFGEAYNLSYADVYDYSSVKQSLKKWEIALGIFHVENEYPWDEPLPEDKWEEVGDYCVNDVMATEAVSENREQDFVAREILADLSGLTVGHTTRQHATRIIFGDNKNPDLVYTDLSTIFPGYEYCSTGIDKDRYVKDDKGNPIFSSGKSIYMNEDPSEGGYVYANPGMYYDFALLDVESLHPHSIIELNAFGSYTQRFKDILDARLAIKHHDYETAKKLFDGKLSKYLGSDEEADKLQKALKIVINSVYGFTSATFDNPFKDSRNVDNIVAKRGALFMITLKNEVEKRGFKVAHIKTDSIKIPNATPEIIKFCKDFGHKYGYNFDHEATFEKMCLVNDAVYICKVKEGKENGAGPGEWSGTGAQFKKDVNPYVFKTLFSHEPIEFDDMCETKSVNSALYLDFNEGLSDVTEFEKLKELRESDKAYTKAEQKMMELYSGLTDEELDSKIAEGHNYRFIGKVGRFVPVLEGNGGGILLREQKGKYYSATGTKDPNGKPYRWKEAAAVKASNETNIIDTSYYRNLVDTAIDTIAQYGDVDTFIS